MLICVPTGHSDVCPSQTNNLRPYVIKLILESKSNSLASFSVIHRVMLCRRNQVLRVFYFTFDTLIHFVPSYTALGMGEEFFQHNYYFEFKITSLSPTVP